MITTGAQGRVSATGGEEMEDREEMEVESTSNVPILAAGGTFIPDTVITEVRHSTKRHRACENSELKNVSEDLLNRHIQDYGLVVGTPSFGTDVLLNGMYYKS
jgi:hypothetical protein